MQHDAYIALGSNLSDPLAQIGSAIAQISGLNQTQLLAWSTPQWYAAVGGPPGQPDYLNSAAHLKTELSAAELFCALMDIENRHGRRRGGEPKNSPRTLDLDILFFDDCQIRNATMTIPHPRIAERLFVLEPLVAIAPQFIHPSANLTVAELLKRLDRGCPWQAAEGAQGI